MTTTIFQQQTIAAAPGDWSATVPFNQFDPSAGLLVDAVFTTAGTVDASASIENLAPVAATVNLDVAAEIIASSPALQTWTSVTPVAVASVNLPAYQGTIDGALGYGALDFGGPSGTVLPNLMASATQVAVVNVGTSGGSPLVGTGTFDVAVNSYATSTVEGNGNLAVLLHGSVGATLSLQYDAVTPSPGSSDAAGYDLSGGFTTAIFIGPLVVNNYVTTTPQVVTLPSETTGWTSTASFVRFNPALGTLAEVLVDVGNTIVSTFSAENLEPVPAFVSMNDSATMTVATPGKPSGLYATAGGWDPVTLGAYDGTMDFAGESGQSIVSGDYSWTPGSATLADPTDLAAFTGTGNITLPVSSAGSSVLTGPSNLLAEITEQTGGTVTVSYVYTPFPTTSQATDTTGLLAHPGVSAQTATAATAGNWSVNAPRMTFIGGFQGPTSVGANPNETFLIGAGADAVINGFSLAAGDKLNLAGLLAGAALAPDLSNLGSFLSVTGQNPGQISGWNTTLAVTGPSGAASLILSGPTAVAVLDLLNAKALILPSH
jgi:hypothetical protein